MSGLFNSAEARDFPMNVTNCEPLIPIQADVFKSKAVLLRRELVDTISELALQPQETKESLSDYTERFVGPSETAETRELLGKCSELEHKLVVTEHESGFLREKLKKSVQQVATLAAETSMLRESAVESAADFDDVRVKQADRISELEQTERGHISFGEEKAGIQALVQRALDSGQQVREELSSLKVTLVKTQEELHQLLVICEHQKAQLSANELMIGELKEKIAASQLEKTLLHSAAATSLKQQEAQFYKDKSVRLQHRCSELENEIQANSRILLGFKETLGKAEEKEKCIRTLQEVNAKLEMAMHAITQDKQKQEHMEQNMLVEEDPKPAAALTDTQARHTALPVRREWGCMDSSSCAACGDVAVGLMKSCRGCGRLYHAYCMTENCGDEACIRGTCPQGQQ